MKKKRRWDKIGTRKRKRAGTSPIGHDIKDWGRQFRGPTVFFTWSVDASRLSLDLLGAADALQWLTLKLFRPGGPVPGAAPLRTGGQRHSQMKIVRSSCRASAKGGEGRRAVKEGADRCCRVARETEAHLDRGGQQESSKVRANPQSRCKENAPGTKNESFLDVRKIENLVFILRTVFI